MNRKIFCISCIIFAFLLFCPRDTKAAGPYTVTFLDWEGNVISEESYSKGDTVEFPEDPEKPSTQMYQYFFSGWDPLPTAKCTGSVTYEPLYIQDYMRYTVRIADHLGGCFMDSYGIYDSVAVMLYPRCMDYFDMDMMISRDQIEGDNMNGKSLWVDFRACVELGLIDYDPTKQYMCTGFQSSIDGQILKLQDFENYRIRGDEDYVPVYEPVESTGTNHMWFVDQFDPDDPERQLSFSEIDLGNTVLEWDIYEMYETQPILKFPFPEVIAGLDGNTYYLNPYKARLYIGSNTIEEYTIPRIFLSHRAVPVDWDSRGSYVLPIYSSSPDFEPPDDHEDYAWVSMEEYDEDYNRTGSWESGRMIPGETYLTAPENPGTNIIHFGHTDRVFTGRYDIALDYMSRPIFGSVNAGESFTSDSLWWRYALGGVRLVPIWEEVETTYIRFIDHDGTVLRNYHGPYYVQVDQPPDPVRENTDDYDYEFVGWKNTETGEVMTDTSAETGGRITGQYEYEAVYTETFKPKAEFFVEVPAAFALSESGGRLSGSMYDRLTVHIETNCDNFYVEVIPDDTVTLTGDSLGDLIDVSVSMDKTRFKSRYLETGGLSPAVRHYEPVIFDGSIIGKKADTYSGNCSFTIRSGYE